MKNEKNLRIGISPRFQYEMQTDLGVKSKTIQYLDQSLSHWISGLGGLPLMIPSVTRDEPIFNPQDYARNLDALVLQGGNDISPSLYGEEKSEKTWRTDLGRDEYELKLIQSFLNEGKPILGICRGMQLINTFFGGTLHQDLETSLNLNHHSSELYERYTHHIKLELGGQLDSIYGSARGQYLVNSIHHQAIKKIGQNLAVEAVAEDNIIEAIRWNGNSFVLGVQWHPEFHSNGDGLLPAEPLLRLLLEQARLRKYYGSRDRVLQPQNVLSFSKSSKFTLGTELELQLIHPETLDLYPMSIPLLNKLETKTEKIKSEIFQSMIEIETGIQPTAQKIEEDLTATFNILRNECREQNVKLSLAGTHPFASYTERILYPSQRYTELIEKNQWIARRLVIFGLHVHIGMESKEQAIRFMNYYSYYLPLLLGLSASSPFWHGDDTGLSSCRSTFFESSPSGGHPIFTKNWEEFEALFEKMYSAGVISSHKDLWWDLRPSPNYGTLEIRACDVMPTIHENSALSALIHTLALYFESNEQNQFLNRVPTTWQYRENKWRATRHGLDFDFILDESGETAPAKRILSELFDLLDPIVTHMEYQKYFSTLKEILANGPPATQMRKHFEIHNDLKLLTQRNVKVTEGIES